MELLSEKEIYFIDRFSELNVNNYMFPDKINLKEPNKFFNNEIGVKYMGYMLKDINLKLYITYNNMMKDSISFDENYNVERSMCASLISSGVTLGVEIKLPNIKNGVDLLTTAHEVGHGLKSYSKLNNTRFLNERSIYDETISILFGKICLDRYINDFGLDKFAIEFDRLNTYNAYNCLNIIKSQINIYKKKMDELQNIEQKNAYRLELELYNLATELYKLISYPTGIALANVYDNFSKEEKEEYLNILCKYILNLRHIEMESILDYFNIPLDAKYYFNNYDEYLRKYEKGYTKKLGGK